MTEIELGYVVEVHSGRHQQCMPYAFRFYQHRKAQETHVISFDIARRRLSKT
jgi:hypothetical protein